jgi:chorismate-pyruvate lyase
MTKALQSAKPDASSLVKTKTNAPTNRIDQKHADNPIGKILPCSILEALYL